MFENDAADAYAVFTMALTLDPCLALAFYQRGYAACLEQRYQEALEDYSQALEVCIKVTQCWILLLTKLVFSC